MYFSYVINSYMHAGWGVTDKEFPEKELYGMFQDWIMMRFPPWLRPNDALGYDALPARPISQAIPVHALVQTFIDI